MSMLLGLLAALAGVATAGAMDTVTSIDFYTDVLYSPANAWNATTNPACGSIDHYTSTMGANASVTFEGNKIVVEGMQNSASGVLKVFMDDDKPFLVNLYSENVTCGVFFEYDVGNGTHTMTLNLLEAAPIIVDGITVTVNPNPVLHIMSISYWTPQADSATSTSVSDSSSTSHHTDVGAIVGAVVSTVVGAILIGGALFLVIRRRRARQTRHRFNPTAMASLSPRTATAPGGEFGSYARMDDDKKAAPLGDDVDRRGRLDVPPPAYSITLGGSLRARSRSPVPDRKPMP